MMKSDFQLPRNAPQYYKTFPISTEELILDMLDILADKIGLTGIERRDFNNIKAEIERRIYD